VLGVAHLLSKYCKSWNLSYNPFSEELKQNLFLNIFNSRSMKQQSIFSFINGSQKKLASS